MTRFQKRLMAAAAAAAVILVPAVGCQRPADDTGRHATATPPPARTADAAVTTATDLLTSIDLGVLLDDRERNSVIDRLAAPSARAELRRLYATERRRVASSYRRPPRFARAALAGYRIDALTQTEARVSIWAATVGGSGSFAPAAGWSTTTVALIWHGDRWRITGVQDEPGPSPSWPIATLTSEGRKFKEYRHAP